MKAIIRLTLICSAITLPGCSERAPLTDAPVSKAKSLVSESGAETGSATTRTEPYEATIGGFKFTAPADWIELPPKTMFNLGEFTVPGEEGPARLTISSARGGIEANLDRWRGQFVRGPNDSEPRESSISFDGNQATLLELQGTFADSLSGNETRKNARMLGVAVALPGTDFFIKMTGPGKTVTDRRDEFLKFVESARSVK
jgi:hypothetical protein